MHAPSRGFRQLTSIQPVRTSRTCMLLDVAIAFMATLFVTPVSQAAVITLSDLNSSIDLDPDSQAGLYNWNVDGVDQLSQQWFWYRIGTSGPESSIDTLVHNPATDVIVSDGNFNPGDDQAVLRYTDSQGRFRITVSYTLTGGAAGSRTSDIIETVAISSLRTTGSLNFSFFQYSDFDLQGSGLDSSVQITNANTSLQTDGVALSETIANPAPTRVEVNYFSATRTALNDAVATNLNNNLGPIFGGDLTWAFQWNFVLAPGATFIISKDKRFEQVPEPSTLCLAGVGAVAMIATARRRRRS